MALSPRPRITITPHIYPSPTKLHIRTYTHKSHLLVNRPRQRRLLRPARRRRPGGHHGLLVPAQQALDALSCWIVLGEEGGCSGFELIGFFVMR